MEETAPIGEEMPKIPFWKQNTNILILSGFTLVGLLFVIFVGIQNSLAPKTLPQPVPTAIPVKSQVVIISSGPQDDVPRFALSPVPIAVPTYSPLDGSWKLYTSSTFQIKYPTNMHVLVFKSTDLQAVHDAKEQIEITNDPKAIHASWEDLSNPSYTDIQIATFGPEIPINESHYESTIGEYSGDTQTINIHGYYGKRGQIQVGLGTIDLIYLVNPKGGHIEISMLEPHENIQNAHDMLNDLLSSLRFL